MESQGALNSATMPIICDGKQKQVGDGTGGKRHVVADGTKTKPEDQGVFRQSTSTSYSQNSPPTACSPMSAIQASEEATSLPSLVFIFPLPHPAPNYCSTNSGTKSSFLVYTLPRSVYEKPVKDPETGKRPSEKFVKKVKRGWRTSIYEADDIRRGDLEHPSIWKRCSGACFRGVSMSLRFITGCSAQTLSRLPPIRKIGRILIVYSTDLLSSADSDTSSYSRVSELSQEEAEEGFVDTLILAKKQAQIRALISSCLLPIALAAEMWVPLIFELTLIYFLVQFRAWKKARFLMTKTTGEPSTTIPSNNQLGTENAVVTQIPSDDLFEFQAIESEEHRKIGRILYNNCSKIAPAKFPPLEDSLQPTARTNSELAPDPPVATNMHETQLDSLANVTTQASTIKSNLNSHSQNSADSLDISHNPSGAKTKPLSSEELLDISPKPSNKKDQSTSNSVSLSVTLKPTAAVAKAFNPEETPDADPSLSDNGPVVLGSDQNKGIESTQQRQSSEDLQPEVTTGAITESFIVEDSTTPSQDMPNVEIASFLIKTFTRSLPPEIISRHELNERRVAEDFNRVMKKATKEYVLSIKKIKKKGKKENVENDISIYF